MFFLRFIAHDWPDAYAKKILTQLRASAQSFTQLVLYDFVVPYATQTNSIFSEIPGSELPAAPYPLLPNLGVVSNQTVMADLQVVPFRVIFRTLWQQMTWFSSDDGCGERTGTYNWAIYRSGGWYGLEIDLNWS